MSKRGGSAITRLPFHYAVAVSPSSGLAQQNLLPSTFPRVLEAADAFDMYRVSKFKFRLLGTTTATTGANNEIQVAGFYPGVTDNAPASVNDISENVYSAVRCGMTVPTEWVNIPKVVLQGYVPWYKTVAGSIDAALERFGTMFFFTSGGSTTTIVIEYRGEFEFKGPANTGATPAARRERMLLEEKARMLKILALPEGKKTPTGVSSGGGSTPGSA